MSTAQAPVLDADNAAFIGSGVSIALASADADGLPSVVRAWACRVSADRRRVSVLVSPAQGEALLAQLAAGRPLAAVFSLPSSHRTIQLKAPVATLETCTDADRRTIGRYVRAFSADLERVGHGRSFAAAYLEILRGPLVRVVFEPAEAFAQTPGPAAGARLGRPA